MRKARASVGGVQELTATPLMYCRALSCRMKHLPRTVLIRTGDLSKSFWFPAFVMVQLVTNWEGGRPRFSKKCCFRATMTWRVPPFIAQKLVAVMKMRCSRFPKSKEYLPAWLLTGREFRRSLSHVFAVSEGTDWLNRTARCWTSEAAQVDNSLQNMNQTLKPFTYIYMPRLYTKTRSKQSCSINWTV